jgi:hypothetical protein
MKTPKYKNYRISYNGKVIEEILATSKKNVMEYIKTNYITYITNENNIIKENFYRLGLFNVELIQDK